MDLRVLFSLSEGQKVAAFAKNLQKHYKLPS